MKNRISIYLIGIFTGLALFIGTLSVLAILPPAPNGENVGGWLGNFFDFEKSSSGSLVVKGNIEAKKPTKNEHLATKAYVDANGGGTAGIGNASAGFDNHGGNFIGLSTEKHAGNFGSKRYADFWCSQNVEGSDHMCNSWELNGLDFIDNRFWYQPTKFGFGHSVSYPYLRCINRQGDDTDCLDCKAWRGIGKGANGIDCYITLPTACCSDQNSPELIPTGPLEIEFEPNSIYFSHFVFPKTIGALGYNFYRNNVFIASIPMKKLDNNADNTKIFKKDWSNDCLSAFLALDWQYNQEYVFEVKTINPNGIESTESISKTITLTCEKTNNYTGGSDSIDNDCDGSVDESDESNYRI